MFYWSSAIGNLKGWKGKIWKMFVCCYCLSGNQEEISQGEKLGVAEDWRGQAGAENHNSDLSFFLRTTILGQET